MNIELEYKNILVPIDFSDYSKQSLKYALDFAAHFKAKLHLIYVVEPSVYPPDLSIGQITLPNINKEMTSRAEKELQKLIDQEMKNSVEIDKIVTVGKPFVEIIDAAKETDADLIIISTHGHSGIEHILFGSTAEKVVRKAPCPVLSLRMPLKGFDYKESLEKEDGINREN